jgi:spermidine synthase
MISMLGSAVGSYCIIYFLNQFGNEITILLVAGVTLLAALALNTYGKFNRILFLSFYTLFLFYNFGASQTLVEVNCRNDFNPRYGTKFKIRAPLYKESNAISYLETYQADQGEFMIFIDCWGITNGLDMENIKSNATIEDSISYFPYFFKKYDSALILGSGAGVEVSRAINAGVNATRAVEINPLIVERMKLLVKGSRNIYNHPTVTLSVEEARNFVIKNKEQYDLIHMGGIKRYGGLGLKDFIFLENYIYTTEAFQSYIDHLNEDGVLFLRDKKQFTERYMSTLISALRTKGISLEASVVVIGERKSI